MPAPTGVWGIDIGQCALKALRLEMVDGKPTATAFDYVEHPKILSQPDADPDQLIRESLDKFLSRNNTGYDQVAIGIAGQSGLARFVKLPPVEEKRIADIVKFEAKQQIPFPLEEVVWDFQKVAGGEVFDGFALETEVGLFAMKRDVIARNLAYFVQVKTEVHIVQMSPLALVNYATYEILQAEGAAERDDTPEGKRRCVVVLDIGTEASNLIITDGGKIIWQRPVPLGGNNFTRALTKEMKLTFAKAEHLKRNAAKSPDLAQILKAIKPVLTDFVGEVQRSLGYFANTHRDAHVAEMVGLGSAFRLPGLHKYLSEKLQLDIKRPTKFDKLAGDKVLSDPLFSENVLTFPVAYGLALQGLGAARLVTNLLPNEIKIERLIRAKKPYAAAAAAALLLGTGAMAMGYSANYVSLTAPQLDKAVTKSKETISLVADQDKKYQGKVSETDEFKRQVKASIAGQDERLNWVRFDEVFSAALPLPGEAGNLKAPLPDGSNQDKFWSGTKGEAALDKFRKRMKQGVPIEQIQEDDLTQDLAMVNVEAVTCRWVDSLPDFFQKAADRAQQTFGRNIAESMRADEKTMDEAAGGRPAAKPPEGAGWVFEVRGFTNHNLGTQFVVGSILRNLQRTDDFATDDQKVGTFLSGVPDPVKGKISHAFVFLSLTDNTPQPNTFKYINRNYTDWIQQAGALGTEGGPAAPPPTAAAEGAAGAPAQWRSLLSPPGGGTPGGGGEAFGFDASPFSPMTPTPAPVPAPTTTPGGIPLPKAKPRVEFVIMFVWKEPLASDFLTDDGGGAVTTAPAGK